MDPVTGYCYGCGRNNDEKKIWKDQNTNDEWKKQNLEAIQKRMEGWQLESFKESYKHKKNNGMSLFKKKQLNDSDQISSNNIYNWNSYWSIFFDLWGAETSAIKSLAAMFWTALLLIAIVFADKKKND